MWELVNDHPVVRNMMTAGTPDGREERYPICPVCGKECDTIYEDWNGFICGCDECMKTRDAWEVEECL